MQWDDYDAVLFDLDGVLTPTALVHMRAWHDMFSAFLADHPDQPPYTDEDYYAYVDGKPRFEGVRSFLDSRGLDVPDGSEDDPADALTVGGLGNRKNAEFNRILTEDGVSPYPAAVDLVDHLIALGKRVAVVSSSRNAPAVLAAAGLADRFGLVVDGVVAGEQGLPGKPEPDTFLYAARRLGATPARSVVIEDAVSGVRAGRAGDFGLVVGVDRGAGEDELLRNGATRVVSELDELIGD